MNSRNARPFSRVPALGFVLAVGLAACSTQQDGGATIPGSSVLVPRTSHVIWRSAGGGFSPQIPVGAACHFEATYDLGIDAQSLSWSTCKVDGNRFDDPAAYSTVTGSRTLTSAEMTSATAAARAVKVSNRTTCGADLDLRSLEVVSSALVSTIYGDDFYACDKQYDLYVEFEGLENLREVLDGMAQ